MALDGARVATALRALADALDDSPADAAAPAATANTPKRGRGRPVTGEAPAANAAQAMTPAASTPADDPFATAPVAAAAPTATIEQVREALTALKAATSQDAALKVLKDAGGADNLTTLKPEKFGAVVAAAKAALPATKTAEPEDDPFAAPAAAAEKPPTLEELKALIVQAQARTSPDTVQKVVMDHGGKAPKSDGSGEGPSLKALPVDKYAAVAAAIKALPTTK